MNSIAAAAGHRTQMRRILVGTRPGRLVRANSDRDLTAALGGLHQAEGNQSPRLHAQIQNCQPGPQQLTHLKAMNILNCYCCLWKPLVATSSCGPRSDEVESWAGIHTSDQWAQILTEAVRPSAHWTNSNVASASSFLPRRCLWIVLRAEGTDCPPRTVANAAA